MEDVGNSTMKVFGGRPSKNSVVRLRLLVSV